MRRRQVVIVGAGVVGLFVARALQEGGMRPLVLDRAGVGAGMSGVQPGGVRQQWGTRINCLLARESLAFYRQADELLQSPVELGFRSCGYLFLAHSEAGLTRLRASVAVQNAAGVPSRLVSPEEACELVPGLRVDSVLGGAWCGEDGYFDRPQSVVEALARGLEVEIAAVTSLRPRGTRWELGLSTGERILSETVVVAAGCATVPLLHPLDVRLPIEPERRYLFFSHPIRERLLEPLVISAERRFAAKQLGNGRVLASALDATGDVESEGPRWRAQIRSGVRELVPVLEYVQFPICVEGVYDVTPDRQPAVGTVPGRDGLWVAAGFSGHGFMLAPAIGRILAEAITGRREDEALAIFSPARFDRGQLVPEPQVI